MRKKLNCLFYAIMATLFVSCNSNSNLMFPTHEVDFMNKTGDVVNGNPLNIDVMGAREVLVCDTLLVILTRDHQGYFKIYSTNTHKLLADIGKQGRAKNEFNNPMSSYGYAYKEGNDIILPIIDNRSTLKNINLIQSIKEETAVIASDSDYPTITDGNIFPLNKTPERQFIFNQAQLLSSSDECEAPKYYVKDGDSKREIKVFAKTVNADKAITASAVYSGGFIRHPQKDIFVEVFNYMDYLFFFDFESDKYYSIHQKGSLSFDDYLDSKWSMIGDKDVYHFSSATCTENFIIFLYGAGDYCIKANDYDPNSTPREILLFDWKGNYLAGAKLNVYVSSIAYDEKHKVLYGLNRRNESVYCFDLSGLVKGVQ